MNGIITIISALNLGTGDGAYNLRRATDTVGSGFHRAPDSDTRTKHLFIRVGTAAMCLGFTGVLLLSMATGLVAQSGASSSFTDSGDYAAYPELQADFTHLQLELEMDEAGQFSGEASYTFQLLRNGIDTLSLDAAGLTVNSARLSGENLDFSEENGVLAISLPDSLPTETAYILHIVYEAMPGFGIHTDEWEMRWGSLLPGAVRHWVPVVDHPRNRFTTDVTFSYPSGYTAAFSGSPSLSGVVSVNQESMRFVSDRELPASSLTFAAGIADRTELMSGRNRIHLMSRSDLLTEGRMNDLAEVAGSTLQRAASLTEGAYPYRDLQLVVLDDSRWEVKNYGSGIIFVYMNEGSLEQQIIQGIAAQWAGIMQVEEQWSDAGAVLLLQEWLYGRLSGAGSNVFSADPPAAEPVSSTGAEAANLSPFNVSVLDDTLAAQADSLYNLLDVNPRLHPTNGLYNEFSDAGRRRWLGWIRSGSGGSYQQEVRRVIPGDLLSGSGILNWRVFADMIYSETGLAMLEAPDPAQVTGDEEGEKQEIGSYNYRVDYELNEAEGNLRLIFEAEGAPLNELIPVTVTEYGSQGPTERSLTFRGATDEVVLSVSPAVSSIDLSVADESPASVHLEQHKPFMYWMYQLRNSDLPDLRADAAVGLRDYRDNPDLQLALLDYMRTEEDLLVRAEMVRTLAAVTNGAAGTAQLFLQRYDPSAPLEHRLAIIEAYSNYPGNEQIISQLRQIIVSAESPDLKLPAIAVMAHVTNAGQFRTFAEEMIPIAEMTPQVPLLLMFQALKGEVESAVQVADALLQTGYSFDLRAGGLSLLLAFDQSMEGWLERLPGLLADSDPRIRYLAAEGLEYLIQDDRNERIEARLEIESDQRVIHRLESF